MSDRALRGSRLGATSYESDVTAAPAERRDTAYNCPRGHHFVVPFSAEADVPSVWECRFCGAEAVREQAVRPEPKGGKPVRTHWDMLLERRSVSELEELLAERLEVLRTHGGVPGAGTSVSDDSRRHRKSA